MPEKLSPTQAVLARFIPLYWGDEVFTAHQLAKAANLPLPLARASLRALVKAGEVTLLDRPSVKDYKYYQCSWKGIAWLNRDNP